MSKKKNGVNFSRQIKATRRRKRAVERLTAQLESGSKSKTLNSEEPLTEADIKRIEREISNLNRKINLSVTA